MTRGSACDTLRNDSDMDFRSWKFLPAVTLITSHGRSKMSCRIRITLMVVLCLFTTLNLGALILNISSPSRAAVAGMSYQDLIRDPDFTRAVQSIAQECRVNVDLAKLVCLPQR
jgi:hypothetical protein